MARKGMDRDGIGGERKEGEGRGEKGREMQQRKWEMMMRGKVMNLGC